MYRRKDRETGYLFAELFPFGGKLNGNNRWLKIAGLIPWDELEDEYEKYFSERMGRPATDGRLVLGALMLRHIKDISDEEIKLQIQESPYLQAFCGFEVFQTGNLFDESSLSRVRKRIGAKFFRELEKKTYEVLIKKKIIRGKGMLVDATVYPESIRYPTDAGLLNRAREWLVKRIGEVGKRVRKKPRTYKRKARQEYLTFSKQRRKGQEAVKKIKKALLQYVRRNLQQLDELITIAQSRGKEISREITTRLEIVRRVYEQQREMYREKKRRIEDRIVSLHKPEVRPIIRGKAGKKVEFGPKVALCHVDGFAFPDHISHNNFNEALLLPDQTRLFQERFGKEPEWCVGDRIYGNRANRRYLQEKGIRDAFSPLGKKTVRVAKEVRWRKQKQRERNRIEGDFGHSKEHVMVHRIRYKIPEGSEIWVRLGLLGMNLNTAIKRI